jgi:MSHA biogenesis protein MshK
MAQRLSTASLVCALVAAGASPAAAAQARLPDPTRPPQAAASAGADAPAPAKGAKPPARLQSVLISPQRRLAVIDGRTVRLGGEIDGARVVAITESTVTLRRGAQTEMLKLYPAVDKKASAQ